MRGAREQMKEKMAMMFDWKTLPSLKKHIYPFDEGSRDDTGLITVFVYLYDDLI